MAAPVFWGALQLPPQGPAAVQARPGGSGSVGRGLDGVGVGVVREDGHGTTGGKQSG